MPISSPPLTGASAADAAAEIKGIELAHRLYREVLGRPYGHIENIRRRMNEIDEEMASGKDIDWNAVYNKKF